jgi:hypothetical protein
MRAVNILTERITFIIVSRSRRKPVKVSFSVFYLVFSSLFFLFLLVGAGYIFFGHFDYVKMKIDNEIKDKRFLFFVKEIKRTKGIVDVMQENDSKVRKLIALNTNRSIIEEQVYKGYGEGGPSLIEMNVLKRIISGKEVNLNNVFISNVSILDKRCKFLQKSYDDTKLHIKGKKGLFVAIPKGYPCQGIITSKYGFRSHPLMDGSVFHYGLDISNVTGTPIQVTADGVVVYSGIQRGYGNVIVVSHGYGYSTLYGHLSERLVEVDSRVVRGQIIGKMGNTGNSTGTHLHYEVHFNGRQINPKQYLADYFFDQLTRENYDKKKFKKFA